MRDVLGGSEENWNILCSDLPYVVCIPAYQTLETATYYLMKRIVKQNEINIILTSEDWI